MSGRITYPVFDQETWIGVIEGAHPAVPYDETIDYKVMIDTYDRVDNTSGTYSPLNTAARTYNLLAALGVPDDKISMALIIHGGAVDAFLSDEAYQARFNRDNPNLPLIRAMHAQGVKFYVCGQTLGFRNIPNEDMCEEAEVTLSAKTAMIIFDQRGYSYLNVNE